MTLRRAVFVLCALLLSGCGFHLRNALNLPANLGPVRVITADRYSPLGDLLADGLRRAGATPADPNASTDVATLQVISEHWADTPISNDQSGRAQEYMLRYAVVFSLQRADGSIAVPQQAVELSRDYLAPATDLLGKASERELLMRELQRDMAASILRRVDAASAPRPGP
ncbi:LPS assembly lipoprotein LptE [Thermomonas hydrothermalis]|uniref:LPS-assembly lipoprotein LptE n=2 Tax=Thermomonas hydrothermalis TaxID=213588 RepID=A0A1M5A0U8_9GAMM|nr:LPS assembly lipoprotein LptE [Thermomonas hydrothermalis]SHF23516.1 LPS-assembly lipoprotein [Thermomonas hydrothermalis]